MAIDTSARAACRIFMMICRNNAYQRRRIIIICVLICLDVILLDKTLWDHIVIFNVYISIYHIMHVGIIHITAIETRACNMDDIAIFKNNIMNFFCSCFCTDFKSFSPVVPDCTISDNGVFENIIRF